MALPDDDEFPEMHEINVTPFIDVMLVLLIVFMVAAPLATVTIPVDAPRIGRPSDAPVPAQPLVLTLRPDLTMALAGAAFGPAGLAAALERATGGDRSRPVFLLADRSIAYGEVMRVMGAVRDGGYSEVSLVALEGR